MTRRLAALLLATLAWAGPAPARRTPPPRPPLWLHHYVDGTRLIKQERWLAAADRLRRAARLQPEPRRGVRLPDGKTVDYAPYALMAYALARAGMPRRVVEPVLEKAEAAGVAPPARLAELRRLVAALPEAPRRTRPPRGTPAPTPVPPTPEPTPAPTPVPATVFLVDGVPPDVALEIDGEALPPGVREITVPPGTHTIAAVRDGETLERFSVGLAPGQRLGVVAAVTPAPTAAPAPPAEPRARRGALRRARRAAARYALPALATLAALTAALLAWRLRRHRRGQDPPPDATPTVPRATLPTPPGTLPVERVGGYRLEARLGAGGMATTYRAVRLADGRTVAVKIPHENALADEAARRRFLREGRLGEQLHHPNIVRVIEAGEHQGWPFLAMELVEGRTLRELLATAGPLPLERALDVARQVAEALDYAHAKGVIHRDLKPENLMVERDGTVRVMDFGIARPLEGGTALTGTSAFVGTPLYAAPEMIAGGPVDHRADLYALGVVLYEMLEGKAPFAGLSPLEQLKMHLDGRFPERDELERPLPDPVWELVARLTARDPGDRPQSAEAVLRELGRLRRALEEGRLG